MLQSIVHMLPRALRIRYEDQVCPYCFETFTLPQTPFRCATDPAQCAPVTDPVFDRNPWNDGPRPRGAVIPAPGGMAHRAICQICHKPSPDRICPHCHMPLPRDIGDSKTMIFAMVGGPAAGKSHYIASILRQLDEQLGPTHDFTLIPLDNETIRRRKEDFDRYVFVDRRAIPKTMSGQNVGKGRVRVPLVFRLSFGGTSLLGRRGTRRTVMLVFFDTAGEDLGDLDVMKIVNRYIQRADGLILLVDPTQLPAVRDKLPPAGVSPIAITPSEILARIRHLVETGRGLRPVDTMPIPLAVVFSKFDAVDPILSPHLQVRATCMHDKGFDLGDFNAVDAEVATLLKEEWGEAGLVHQVRSGWKYAAFFGLSAIGSTPDNAGRISRYHPRRVADPFLWLLHHHGLLKAAP